MSDVGRPGTGDAIVYQPHSGVLLANDPEGKVKAFVLKPRDAAMSRVQIKHSGKIWVRARPRVLTPSNHFLSCSSLGSRSRSGRHTHVQSIAVSDHHPFLASTATDGTCIIGNTVRALKVKALKASRHLQDGVFPIVCLDVR